MRELEVMSAMAYYSCRPMARDVSEKCAIGILHLYSHSHSYIPPPPTEETWPWPYLDIIPPPTMPFSLKKIVEQKAYLTIPHPGANRDFYDII